MIADGSVHWISWKTSVPNNDWNNWHAPVRLYESINCGNRGIGRHNDMPASLGPGRSLSTMFSASKLRTPNMYCWSRKTLVAIHWTHLRLNLICIKSFCPQKTNAVRCNAVRYVTTSTATSPYLMFRNDVTVTSSSWYSCLNSLQNIYFGLFIFEKLTEWRCFVTYLSNDPRICSAHMRLFIWLTVFSVSRLFFIWVQS